jgi:TRAP-type mannitol/chloroaromatic compound transport system substrate-binding protein
MQIGTLLKTTTAALLVGGILGVSGLAGDAAAQDKRVKWKMGSAFPSKLVQLGSLGVSLQDKVERISGGNIQLKFFEPHALVPPLEMFDAISAGSLDAAWSTPGYWFGKEKALALFAAVPFGPSAGEYGAWMYYGGGKQLMDEIYAKHNIKSLTCGVIAPEASGWFRKEINTRRSSVARSTPRNTQCRRSTWISASIRSPSTTTSRAGTSSRPCSS